ncbi:MAG: methyl-accepting chemotaxis protein, partial [Brevundimonas sp.]
INIAVNQMDQVTQQNAAMVEQATAASNALRQETAELSAQVSFFQVSGGKPASAAPAAPSARSAPRPAPRAEQRVVKVANGPDMAVGSNADGWEEF